MGPEGAAKCPLPNRKGPGRKASEGPCDPLAHKKAVENPEKEGTNLPLDRASPGPHSGQGWARRPFSPLRASRNAWPQNKTEGEKQKPITRSTEHPCRLASQEKKGLRTSTRRIPKTHGAQKGTPKKSKKRDARPKRAKTSAAAAAGHKKRKGTNHKSACGVSCDYLSCIS